MKLPFAQPRMTKFKAVACNPYLFVVLTLSVGIPSDDEIDTPRNRTGSGQSVGNPATEPFFAGRRLSKWISLLQSDDEYDRLGAARSLGDMGADAKGAVPSLIVALSDRDSFIRSAAAHSLGQIGPDAASALPALVRAFKISSGFDKGIIGPAIAKIGPRAVPALVELSKDSNEYVRWEAARALRIVGPGAIAAEPRLFELLSDKKSGTHVEAAFALWKLRPRSWALEVLIKSLDDPEEFARSNAADYLAEIGPDAARAVPGLTRALGDQSGSVRGRATKALGRIGAPAKAAIPALLKSAARPGQWFFLDKTIRGIGPEAVPPLLKGLDDPVVRIAAADALGEFGALAKAGVPRIRKSMESARGEDRVKLARALWRISGDSTAVSVLIALIREDNFIVQLRAFDVLQEIGPGATAAIPTLIEMLGRQNRFLREYAAKVLARVGPAAKSAIPALEKTLKDLEGSNRIAAAIALWRIVHSQAALNVLAAEAQDFTDSGSTFAVIALGDIGPEAKPAVPALIEALKTESIFGKAIVAQALTRIGAAAKAAIPRLIEIYDDIHNTERDSFAKAIKAIDLEAAAPAGVR